MGTVATVFGFVPINMLLESSVSAGTAIDFLDTASAIVAPLLGALATVIIWLHRRIKELEEQKERQHASLYGIQGDTLAKGVTDELRQLREEIHGFQESMDNRLTVVEDKVEDIEEEIEDD